MSAYKFDGDVDCKDEVPTVRCVACGLDAEWYLHWSDPLGDSEAYRCRCVNVGCSNRPKEDKWVYGEFFWNGEEWDWED
jgi:hypothetical protein